MFRVFNAYCFKTRLKIAVFFYSIEYFRSSRSKFLWICRLISSACCLSIWICRRFQPPIQL